MKARYQRPRAVNNGMPMTRSERKSSMKALQRLNVPKFAVLTTAINWRSNGDRGVLFPAVTESPEDLSLFGHGKDSCPGIRKAHYSECVQS